MIVWFYHHIILSHVTCKIHILHIRRDLKQIPKQVTTCKKTELAHKLSENGKDVHKCDKAEKVSPCEIDRELSGQENHEMQYQFPLRKAS